MSAVVADTHTIIWFLTRSRKLSATARAALVNAEQSGYPIYVPTIIVVELRYLIEKGTITQSEYDLIVTTLRDPAKAANAEPLDLNVAEVLSQIPRATVPDMPDRIIAATALALGIPLVTRDKKIQSLTNITTIW
jgi:PIN domain nuclease of toxin-antitoxin system